MYSDRAFLTNSILDLSSDEVALDNTSEILWQPLHYSTKSTQMEIGDVQIQHFASPATHGWSISRVTRPRASAAPSDGSRAPCETETIYEITQRKSTKWDSK